MQAYKGCDVYHYCGAYERKGSDACGRYFININIMSTETCLDVHYSGDIRDASSKYSCICILCFFARRSLVPCFPDPAPAHRCLNSPLSRILNSLTTQPSHSSTLSPLGTTPASTPQQPKLSPSHLLFIALPNPTHLLGGMASIICPADLASALRVPLTPMAAPSINQPTRLFEAAP